MIIAMYIYLLTSMVFGFMCVLQNGLNRQIGQQSGLASVLLINALMILLAAIALVLTVFYFPSRFGTFLAGSGSSFDFKWWYLLPGLFGFSIIAGLPYCMNKIGALAVFVVFVTAQVVASMLWDNLVDGMPLTLTKISGAAIALIGVILVSI